MPWSRIAQSLSRLTQGVVLSLCCAVGMHAQADNIESILSPGPLIQGHAKWQDDCKQCHVKFDREAQSGLCSDCHKPVGADVKNKTGFHGRQEPQACRNCHTDHKGRAAKVVDFDPKKFDHAQTDYTLKGKHQPVECVKCHVQGKKYREAPSQCIACHKKDDTHKGSLGDKCLDCHTEASWKEARFDHSKTRFALEGKHVQAKCADCHKTPQYKETPRQCLGCHKKDDDSAKGHKGQYGEKCESCHNAQAWKPSTFNHDSATKYALRGKHRTATCVSCHTGHLYRVKLAQDCNSCHVKDDKHKGTLGKDCQSCHNERSWKEESKFDHDKSRFPLMGKHRTTQCKECHASPLFKEAPMECVACHKKDDKHNKTLGEQCAACHGETDWKTTTGRFNHDKTRFVLRNAHAAPKVKCVACHKDLQSFRNTAMECLACHKKDDKHEGQLGAKCESCHTDRNWRIERFDHRLSVFPLTGRHLTATCKSCHLTPRYKDAAKDCYSCHKKEDKHRLTLGTRCDSCHNARAWALWDFDHGKRAKYVLDGAHRKVRCDACHTQQAPVGKDAAPIAGTCVSCHRRADVHDGQFGVRCEQCHVTENWKKLQSRFGGLTH